MDEKFQRLKQIAGRVLKIAAKPFIIVGIIIIAILVLFAGVQYIIDLDDGTYKEGDKKNVPYTMEQHTNNITIDANGNITTSKTAKELWDEMIQNGSRVNEYLNGPEELLKMMNAEMVTNYLDTRKNPDEAIDWKEINKDVNSKTVQGIIKLKRAKDDGTTSTMTYVDPETFQYYIDTYNKTGSEEDKQEALSHFTIEKGYASSSSISAGIIYGTGSFTQYTDLTEDQLRGLASQCKAEQGSLEGVAAEASLMANRFELYGSNFGTGGTGLYNYVRDSGWFAHSKEHMDSKDAGDDYVEVVRAVLVNGKRTLPGYIDEHDCFKDIVSSTNNGSAIIINDRSQYVQHVTKMTNKYGSNYTFYSFPTDSSDPFGYTREENRIKIGDFYYDFATGQEVNKREGDLETTSSGDGSTINGDVMKWPTDGTTITSYFGPREEPTDGASTDHGAIDIDVPIGTNVYATEAGTVTTAGWSDSGGNMVTIDHGNGYISKYMHNSSLKVAVGDKVEKGQIIALSGNTGISTGPHVHFQIEYNEQKIDPLLFQYDNGMGNGVNGIGSNASTVSTTNTLYAKVATWNEVIDTLESNDESVETYENRRTYNMTSTKINYQEFVSGYKMPFDYLWALLVVGQEKDFVFDLADLIYGSEIEITVHDNLITNTNISTDTYTNMTKVITSNVKVKVEYSDTTRKSTIETGGPFEGEKTEPESPPYKTTHTVITKTNTLETKLTKANVWIVNYIQEFSYQTPNDVETSDDIPYANEEYSENPNRTDHNDGLGLGEEYRKKIQSKYASQDTNVSTTIQSLTSDYYYKTINRNINIYNKVESKKYVSSPAKIVEKTNKQSEEPNFVTLFLKYKKFANNIKSAPEWLFEILEKGKNTVDMVDLTKYLLYKATNKDYGVTEFDFEIFDPANFKSITTGVADGGLSLKTTMFTKEVFIQALQAYYDKTHNQAFYNNFLSKAEELYDTSVKNNVNPELVVITAKGEGNFSESGGRYNYWGLNVPNGASSGDSFSSFSEGIAAYAKYIQKYETGDFANIIMQRYEERKAAGCDPLGYGMPGTLSGMQSLYSYLGKHEYGSSGAGGYYYMDPARAGVTKIYATHEEFLSKCQNSGLPEHAAGTETTVWEQGQYTAWQVEQKLKYWEEIFGDFGSLNSSSVSSSNIAVANGSAAEKLAYLFPNGTPTTEAQARQYMTTINVALTTKNGTKTTGSLTVHKAVANDVQEVFQAAQNAGFKIYAASGYSFRSMNNGGSGNLSHHSYGIAIDINVNENYSRRGSTIYAGSFWDPLRSEYSIPKDGILVNAFKAKGWKWGGDWSGNYQDYMHFSFTGN